MFKRKNVKRNSSFVVFITGDSKSIKVNNGICKISEFLAEKFNDSQEVYFENVTARSVELLTQFYNEYLGLSAKQIEQLGDPKNYLDVKKADAELIRVYDIYKKLSYADLFGLLKTVNDMRIKSLMGVLSHIVAQVIATKKIEKMEEEFANNE